jgi:hypothetical protein
MVSRKNKSKNKKRKRKKNIMADQERARTGNISNEEYLADYPNAEVNPDRAEEMAHGSKLFEERVVHAGKLAKLSARGDYDGVEEYKRENAGELANRHSVVDIAPLANTDNYMDIARSSRDNADKLAEKHGNQYDISIKSPVDDEVAGLMSGKKG